MKKPSWPNLRDGILFFSGLAGLFFEMVVRRPPDYGFLPILGGMMSLPAFLNRPSRPEKPNAAGQDSPG